MRGNVVFIGLRHLRAPLVTLVCVYAIGIAGLVLIPGTTPTGERWTLSFAEAFYFMSYTATTIGFGEIPHPFGASQRLWVTLMIYGSVVGWAYLIAALLALARDTAFRGAIEEAAFARSIRTLREPFYLICGLGETGASIGRALDAMGRRFVVIDLDPRRLDELDLMDLQQSPPALCADVRVPEQLREAGLQSPHCVGVLALTESDQANLAVAMAVRLLNPKVPVIARAMTPGVARNMASFGTDHIIDPFSRFGEYLELALAAPATHRLVSRLTSPHDQPATKPMQPPRGHWVVVGYGRFGRAVTLALRAQGHDVTVVDPDETSLPGVRAITGTGTEPEPLIAGGIRHSVGVIAGTEDDIVNLSVAVTARELNGALFTVVRQNLAANEALFSALQPDVIMMPSRIIADACLAELRAPHLETFLGAAKRQGNDWSDALLKRLDA
ncbi:MAG: potassium channel family protein, partial [Gammaproteobacteria bacterium]